MRFTTINTSVSLTHISMDDNGSIVKLEEKEVWSLIPMENNTHLEFSFDFIGPWVRVIYDMKTGNMIRPIDDTLSVYDFEMLRLSSSKGVFSATLAYMQDEDNVTLYKLVGSINAPNLPDGIPFFDVPGQAKGKAARTE